MFRNLAIIPEKGGHEILAHNQYGPVIYCPRTKDTATGVYTSAGILCTCCNKHVTI